MWFMKKASKGKRRRAGKLAEVVLFASPQHGPKCRRKSAKPKRKTKSRAQGVRGAPSVATPISERHCEHEKP